MFLAYISRTRNIEKIISKLNLPGDKLINIGEDDGLLIGGNFCLLTYTDMLGQIPPQVTKFLDKNFNKLVAVAGSGNRNFGANFCGAARKISQKYGVPLIGTFELSGDDVSILSFKEKFLALGE